MLSHYISVIRRRLIHRILLDKKLTYWLSSHCQKRFFSMYYEFWTGKRIDFREPKDINEKMFWLACYWQDPRIVLYADKLSVRKYVEELGLGYILSQVYSKYDTAEEIDFAQLPERFVLKCNHCGGGTNMVLCKDKIHLDENSARKTIAEGLQKVIGMETCEFHYQYIRPRAYAEEFIGNENEQRLEIQFFCFNGRAHHILVRNDLGDAAKDSFAISYDMAWNRVHDRKTENMSIDIPRPKKLEEMIAIANKLASPFPQVRIDLYLVNDEVIYFGEMTFTTSGNVLWNYTEKAVTEWGKELVLPAKLETKWSDVYRSYRRTK